MIRMLSVATVLLSIGTAADVTAQSAAPSACTQWNVTGSWVLTQSNGPVVTMELKQADGVLSGTATYEYEGEGGLTGAFGGIATGTVEGTSSGESVRFTIKWDRKSQT